MKAKHGAGEEVVEILPAAAASSSSSSGTYRTSKKPKVSEGSASKEDLALAAAMARF